MDGIFVDDSDPNIIFSANWFTGLGTYEYNKTAHGTTAATANVVYTFKGKAWDSWILICNPLIRCMSRYLDLSLRDNRCPSQ